MINTDGACAVLDHNITLNWANGPTLHKIGAQVRYHTPNSATSQTLRVNATHRASDEPDVYISANADVQAAWTWRELGPGWCVSLAAKNISDEDVYIDALELLRVDPAFGGVFSLGAPTGLWQCARAELSIAGMVEWELWSPALGNFTRARQMLIQPAASNRLTPPALLFSAPRATEPAIDLELVLTGERFERFVAASRTDGMLLAPEVTVSTSEVAIVAGDAAFELLEWYEQQVQGGS